MSLMSDSWIIDKAKNAFMIQPFCDKQVSISHSEKKIISYGVSSYGYDVRLADEFYLFPSSESYLIDPKNFSQSNLIHKTQVESCIIPPNSFLLGRTVEYFKIPKNVLVVCVGKSTYARCGLVINVTPLEPEFEGQVVLELSNTTHLPIKVYANEGICQFLFFMGHEDCSVTYKGRNGKYMNQTGVTFPIV
jgi:dCTP deaminase